MEDFIIRNTIDTTNVSFENGRYTLDLVIYSKDGEFDSIGMTVASVSGKPVFLNFQIAEWGFEIDCDNEHKEAFNALFAEVEEYIASEYNHNWEERPTNVEETRV